MKTPDEDEKIDVLVLGPEELDLGGNALQRLEVLDALVELISESKEALKGVTGRIYDIDKEIQVLQLQRQRLLEAQTACKQMLLDGLPGNLDPGEYKHLRIAIYDKIQCASATKLKQTRPVGPIQPLPPPTVGDWYKFAVESEEAGAQALTRGLSAAQYRDRAPWELPVAFGEILTKLQEEPVSVSEESPMSLAEEIAIQDEAMEQVRLLSAKDLAESFEKVKEADKIVSMSVPDPDLDEDVFFDEPVRQAPAQRRSLIDRVFSWVMDRLS